MESYIEPWLSDALSRILTGGGWIMRTLYTNTEQTLVDVQLPIVLSGINDVVVRGDLLDRTLLVRLPTIPDVDDARKDEEAFSAAWELARPRILGALLDGAVMALRNRPTVRIARLPRMADFAKWAAAATPAFGWTAEEFLEAYAENRGQTNLVALEHQPIVPHLHTVVREEGGKWVGPASLLLAPAVFRKPFRPNRVVNMAFCILPMPSLLYPPIGAERRNGSFLPLWKKDTEKARKIVVLLPWFVFVGPCSVCSGKVGVRAVPPFRPRVDVSTPPGSNVANHR
jgi:hypothetical protein